MSESLHQGQKFLTRFDPNSYITCTQLMDSHDVGRGRGGEEMALNQLNQPSLIIGIDSEYYYYSILISYPFEQS